MLIEKESINLTIHKNIAIIKINEKSDLELAFKIFKFLISNSKWIPESVYKLNIGANYEITRKKEKTVQFLRKIDLEEFIEFILKGFYVSVENSEEFTTTTIHGIEIRSHFDYETKDIGDFLETHKTW